MKHDGDWESRSSFGSPSTTFIVSKLTFILKT